MRRSKSAHVKCDCGEKTSKCVHLLPSLEGHRESCCCHHGGRCTCCHKKDQPQLDTVPESDSDQETSSSSGAVPPKPTRIRRSRASTQNSEGMLTFDEHGHHRPTYKHTKPHQTSGPYQLARGHSIHSDDSASNRSLEDLPSASSVKGAGRVPQAQDQRLTKSETASPLMTGQSSTQQSSTSLPPLDLSAVQNWPSTSFPTGGFDMFTNMDDIEQPIVSAGLSTASVDWGQYGLDFSSRNMSEFAPSSFDRPPSFGGFDQPSTLTSAEVSEVEDLGAPTGDEIDPIGTFSRTNTSSTEFSFSQSQENLAGMAMGLDGSDFDFKIGKEMEVNKFYESALSAAEETSVAAQEMSFVQNDPLFWPDADVDYNGLPSVNDISDANAPNFWRMA